MQLDLDQPISQRQFAILLDCSREAINQAVQAGVLVPGASALEWLRSMHKDRTETAAGRRGDGPLDLAQERARLAKLQADRIAIENKKKMAEVLHYEPFSLAFSSTLVMVKTKLLGLPYKLTSRASSVTPRDVSIIDAVIKEVLTDLSESAPFPRAIAVRIEELENSLWAEAGVDRKAIANGSTSNGSPASHLDENNEVENAERNGRPTKAKALEETRA